MRTVTQLGIVAVLAALGARGCYTRGHFMPGTAANANVAAAGAAQRATPVNAKPARQGSIDERIEAVGTALANESITVTAKISGIVKAVRFTDGQPVKPGAAVVASASAYPGQPFNGTVTVVDSRVDPISRSAEVRAEIPNVEGALKSGMFLTVQLTLGRRENAVLIPEECLVPEGTRQ